MRTEYLHDRWVKWIMVAEFHAEMEYCMLEGCTLSSTDVAVPHEDGVFEWLGIDADELDIAVLHFLVITHQPFTSCHTSAFSFKICFLLILFH